MSRFIRLQATKMTNSRAAGATNRYRRERVFQVGIRSVSAHGIQIAHAGRLASSMLSGNYETEISARY
jgi:hypothetical protein